MLRTILFLLPAILLLAAPPAAAESQRRITVQGQGKVAAAPDMVTITAGVEHHAASAGQAMVKSNADLARLIALLKQAGIEARDIRTSNFYLAPVYPRNKARTATPPAPVGYRAGGTLNIRVRQIDRAGPLLDKLMAAGLNRVGGLAFSIAEPAPLLAKARRAAVADAKARAALYAAAAGLELGNIVTIDEGQGPVPRPEFQAMRTSAMSSSAIAPGEQEIRATVTITFAIK